VNLVVDFGNTRIKAGLFSGNTLREHKSFDHVSEILPEYTAKHIKHCIVASVTEAHSDLIESFNGLFDTHLFTAATKIPLKNMYKSAVSLGSDRIAASAGAWTFHPNKNVLTIDAGTCIKYNFVNHNNEYLGGAISPGIPMRLKAMHQFTAKLPPVALDPFYNALIGKNTIESLQTGAQLGAACEVDEMINRYLEEYPDLVVMLTGGDAEYLGMQLKNRFFTSPQLLLHGLNTILRLHLEK